MDDYLLKVAKEIETLVVKARYYERYHDYKKREHSSCFLNEVVKQDLKRLSVLEQELILWRKKSKADGAEKDYQDSFLLNSLIQEAMLIYNNLFSECEIN